MFCCDLRYLCPPPRPCPLSTPQTLRALIFDSYYDPYRGVVCQFRVMDGCVSKGDVVTMMNTGKEYQLDEIGVLAPTKIQVAGQSDFWGGVGWGGRRLAGGLGGGVSVGLAR